MPATAYVFGNEIGQRVADTGRAGETAVLKSHGFKPCHTKTASLTPESRAALAAIDLHFHDLRREAGSRWLEGGVPLHVVRDWLGHTSIAQTRHEAGLFASGERLPMATRSDFHFDYRSSSARVGLVSFGFGFGFRWSNELPLGGILVDGAAESHEVLGGRGNTRGIARGDLQPGRRQAVRAGFGPRSPPLMLESSSSWMP